MGRCRRPLGSVWRLIEEEFSSEEVGLADHGLRARQAPAVGERELPAVHRFDGGDHSGASGRARTADVPQLVPKVAARGKRSFQAFGCRG